jgi:iron(III) transport system substrate-binding protein
MKIKVFLTVLMAFVLSCTTPIFTASAADSISAYMGFSREVNEALAQQIQDKLGIEVKNITLSWGEIWARLQTESPRFNADMVMSFGASEAINGAKKGYYEKYQSPGWDGIPDAFKSTDGSYYALGTFSFLLLSNTKKLAELGYEVPKSYQDLLDPKWKGQIVIPSPRTSGTAFMINYSFLQLYGEEEGWEFLKKLDENVAFYTKSGNAPTELVGRGEYLLGIGADENVLKRISDGYPLQWTVPAEGIGYEGNYCTILKGTKKLELAKKVMDYLGSEEISAFLGKMGYIPPRPGSISALYGEVQPKFIELDHEWAVKNKRRIVKQWKGTFLMKETEKAKKVGDEKEKAAAAKQ